ncbi:hypothetical protein GEV33_015462 [Tenebrio molitor]|nr:hypothetical protein GEV33_015462 [Tenebrio molitor]
MTASYCSKLSKSTVPPAHRCHFSGIEIDVAAVSTASKTAPRPATAYRFEKHGTVKLQQRRSLGPPPTDIHLPTDSGRRQRRCPPDDGPPRLNAAPDSASASRRPEESRPGPQERH